MYSARIAHDTRSVGDRYKTKLRGTGGALTVNKVQVGAWVNKKLCLFMNAFKAETCGGLHVSAFFILGGITLRGGINHQINELFQQSEIFKPGVSKHEIKEQVREEIKTEFKAKGVPLSSSKLWEEMGIRMPIFSYKTAEIYKQSVWHPLANWAKQNMGIKDIEKIDGKVVSAWLKGKVEEGISKKTFQTYAGAVNKLGKALTDYSNKTGSNIVYDFKNELREVRSFYHKEKGFKGADKIKARAYQDPKVVVNNVENIRGQVIARIQYEGGARISEALSIKKEDLLGNNRIRLQNTKGGLIRETKVSSATYQKLNDYLEKNSGRLYQPGEKMKNVSEEYRRDLAAAARKTNQAYYGSHGLRWNYARELYSSSIRGGKTPEQAVLIVSKALGHRRPDITYYYLFGAKK